jgi:uncharacterized protein YbgA (DUF1722 family)
VDTLGQFFTWIPISPEVDMQQGIPRQGIRPAGQPRASRLTTAPFYDAKIVAMQRSAVVRLHELAQTGLHGCILQPDILAYGLERERSTEPQDIPRHHAHEGFAAALRQRFPLLPIEDAGRLHNMSWRENFIERVFAYYRWIELLALSPTSEALGRFHMQHKLTLLAHSRGHYHTLVALMAQASLLPMDDLLRAYGSAFMACMQVKATPKKHANVLYHLLGHLKRQLDTHDKQEVITCIEQSRDGLLPLIVPLTLLRHHFRRHPVAWVLEQTYMSPYPAELMLRYHS